MNVNSLQEKKRSEMMGEYVAGRNRVNVMPAQIDRRDTRSRAQSIVQNREAEYKRQQEQHQGARSRAQSIVQSKGIVPTTGAATGAKTGAQAVGTVLTQEQILANNINDIIKQMNTIMSQPGQMLAPSYSPYYNIFMEQYRENAKQAEANAYARAVAGSGGYGSSYATMAGQQAYRDTMEGFIELTPSLVQTKGQAMSDLMQQYQMAKGLKDELATNTADVNDATFDTYATAVNNGWYTGSNEAAVKARLENLKAGNPEIDVDRVMEMLQNEWNAANETTVGENGEGAQISGEARAAYNSIVGDENYTGWDGSRTESVKNSLRNQGYKESDIEAVIGMLESDQRAAERDLQNANKIMYEKALDDPEGFDVTSLGYSAEDAADMTAAEKKQAILDAAGEATKRGELAKTYYPLWMFQDAERAMRNVKDGKTADVAETLAGLVISFEDGVNAGYMSQQIADRYLKRIAEMAKDTDLPEKYRDQLIWNRLKYEKDDTKTILKAMSLKGVKGEKLDALASFIEKYWEVI